MSGYLQRLTSAVLNSDRNIHPVLGSVFSPSARRGMPENLAEETVIPSSTATESLASGPEGHSDSSRVRAAEPVSTAATPRGEGVALSISAVPPFQPLAAPSRKAAAQAGIAPASQERAPFRPLVTKGEARAEELTIPSLKMNFGDGQSSQPDDLVSRERVEAGPSASNSSPPATSPSDEARRNEGLEPASARRTSFQAAAQSPSEVREKSALVSRSPSQQLLVENLRRTPEIFPAVSNAFPSDAKRKHARGDSRHTREPAPREPDEIQIHIGRIEVIAVPPPPPVREVRPTQKPLSLDDYLKRGNGRAR